MKRVVIMIAGCALAGCSGGSNLLGGGNAAKSPSAAQLVSAPVNDPKTRAVQVAWNVSRAQKCGFNLDAATLKTNYLTYETTNGFPADRLANLEKAYEFSRIETGDRIAKVENYCSDKRVSETRADLGRYLAGDFAARKVTEKKAVPQGGFFDAFDTGVKLPAKTSEEALLPKE